MQVIYPQCAGLDVHKKDIYGCAVVIDEKGKKHQEIRRFGAMTRDLFELADWLKDHGITHVAMEATGVYCRPVWAVLEGQFELLLVNPHHVHALPGRKTDAKDCEWLADLLQHGLLRSRFVPPTEIQDLRDLTRYRVELTQARSRVANRIQKVLEQANIKLSSVASVKWRPVPAFNVSRSKAFRRRFCQNNLEDQRLAFATSINEGSSGSKNT